MWSFSHEIHTHLGIFLKSAFLFNSFGANQISKSFSTPSKKLFIIFSFSAIASLCYLKISKPILFKLKRKNYIICFDDFFFPRFFSKKIKMNFHEILSQNLLFFIQTKKKIFSLDWKKKKLFFLFFRFLTCTVLICYMYFYHEREKNRN